MKFIDMKKYIMMMAAAVLSISALTGCDDDSTAGLTYVEDFPVFTDANGAALDGSEVYLEIGQTYDASYSASINGKDCTPSTVVVIKDVDGNEVEKVDASQPGLYNIYYSGESATGIGQWTAHRTVFVYDPAVKATIAGSYTVDMNDSYRVMSGATQTFAAEAEAKGFGSKTVVNVKQLCPGFFSASDLMAGWYDQIRSYNVDYPGMSVLSAYLSLNADNSITMLSCSDVPLFGIAGGENFVGTFDPSTGRVTFSIDVDDMFFSVLVNNNDYPDTDYIDEPDSK